jgi:hypothetical protein
MNRIRNGASPAFTAQRIALTDTTVPPKRLRARNPNKWIHSPRERRRDHHCRGQWRQHRAAGAVQPPRAGEAREAVMDEAVHLPKLWMKLSEGADGYDGRLTPAEYDYLLAAGAAAFQEAQCCAAEPRDRAVEQAYRCNDLFAKRKRVVADWACHCASPKAAALASVVPIWQRHAARR